MNQTKFKAGSFSGTGAAINLDLGFVPDFFNWWMNEAIAATNVAEGKWDSGMAAGDALLYLGQDAAGAAIQPIIEVTNGITALNTTKQIPDKWKASTAYAIGDIVHPSINNGYYYYCKTAGTSHSAEPTWLTVVGGDTSEGGGTCVWTCHLQSDYEVRRTKVQGVTLGSACTTNAKAYRYIAMRGN